MNRLPQLQFARFARVFLATSILAFVFVSLWVPRSAAGLFTLTDENSVADFDTSSQDNAYQWTVDGTNQLFQQAFWYRIGATAEQSLDTLPHPTEGVTDTNFDGDPDTLFVRYDGAGFRIEVRYTLDGGLAGSLASDMAEQITISNLGAAPLDFHFFQYSDFDLNGTIGNDTAIFPNANAVIQSEGAASIAETVITPIPSHREIDVFANILDDLNDPLPTTLSDTPATGVNFGPGDVTWAYQWDIVVPPSGSFQISKDKNLSGVPEPTGIIVLSICFALVAAIWRRR